MKKILILTFLFVLITSLVNADYSYIGQEDYFLGKSQFIGVEPTKSYDLCTNPRLNPISADLDNDGKKEIAALCDGSINLYNYSEGDLDVIDGIYTGDTEWSDWIAYDIDGDSQKELILSGKYWLMVYSWDNGTLTRDTLIDISPTGAVDTFIICKAANKCMMFWSDFQGIGSTTTYIRGIPFTASALLTGEMVTLDATGGGATLEGFCFPDIRNAAIGDMTGDKEDEYIIVYLEARAGSNIDHVHVGYIQTFANNSVSTMGHEVIESAHIFTDSSGSCTSADVRKKISGGLVGNFDGKGGNGDEVITAIMTGDETFKLYAYNLDEGQITTHPTVLNGNGYLISNPFMMNVFPDTDRDQDYCVLGFDDSNNRLDLVCGSVRTDEPVRTRQFYFNNPDFYPSDSEYDFPSRLVHSLDDFELFYNDNNGIINPDELLTTYGIFYICDYPQHKYNLLATGELCEVLKLDEGESSVIADDYQRNGRADIILISEDMVGYYDDDFINRKPRIEGAFEFNPCLTQRTIENDTFVGIKFTAFDEENDPVTGWASLYADDPNEQNTSKVTVNSGSLISLSAFELRANQTGVYTLRLYVYDEVHNTTPTTLDYTFTVDVEGERYNGGCIDTGTIDPIEEGAACQVDADCPTVQKCLYGVCVDKEPSDLRDELIDPSLVPQSYHPIIALMLIAFALIGVPLYIAREYQNIEGKSLIFMGGGSALLTWIACIIFGLIPVWTLAVTILVSAAILGIKTAFHGKR